MKLPHNQIRLISRGDDAGSCESADLAILEACDRGILRNVSIMVPGPTFAHAVKLLKGRADLCLGLHVTLNAEWEAPKWGPVLPTSQVSSLVDENGFFLPSPGDLHHRGFDEEQAMAEITAQLNRAREAGLNIAYIDEHMGVCWIGGLRQRLTDLARREGLVNAANIPSLPSGSRYSDWVMNFRDRLAQAKPGAYVLVNHPGGDCEDMRRFHKVGQTLGEVARERDAERRGLIDPRLPDILNEYGVELTQYTRV